MRPSYVIVLNFEWEAKPLEGEQCRVPLRVRAQRVVTELAGCLNKEEGEDDRKARATVCG